MQIQMGMTLAHRSRGSGQSGGGQAGPAALFGSVNANGWTADYPNPPTPDPVGNPETFLVQRQGFSPLAQPATHSDLLVVTKRLRQPFPAQASLTASTVSLSDYIYSSDTVAGVPNGSTEISPAPIANWVMPDRLVVGNSVTLEVVAFHRDARNGEEVACVEFSATDGTATVTALASASAISPRATDRNPVIVYRATLDLSTLANPATITCNARVFPWVGTAASVRDSAQSSQPREFSPRTFRRDTARLAAPPLAYVTTTGNDTTGVVSTTPAAASAQPFATILAAIKALKAATGVTGGRIDGCEVRLGAGNFVLTSLAATDVTGGIQDVAALTITRDPAVSAAAAIVTFGTATFRPRFPYLRLSDLTVQRTGTLAFAGETGAPLSLVLDGVVFENNNHNASVLSTAALSVFGCDLRNAGTSPLAAGANEIRILRGLLNTSGVTIENWCVVGSRLTGGTHGAGNFAGGTRSSNGAICAFNYLSGYRVAYGGLAETISAALVQNVIEFFSATSNPGLGFSADGILTSTLHAVLHHNTVAGFFNHGRTNHFYDETAGTARTHRLASVLGNIHVSVNNKGDVFMSDGSRTGNWPYLYGAGVAGEFHQFDAASANFRQEFAGLGSVVGTSATTPLLPQFGAPAHTTSGPAAGAGGGAYTISPASPARGLLSRSVLRFDLAGATRPATGPVAAGAYA